MKLTENNCPILKYIRWEKSLFEHPDFKDTIIPLNSERGKELVRKMEKGTKLSAYGLKASRIINTSKLGAHGFLRPYTQSFSKEVQEMIKRSGGKASDYNDLYVDIEPIDGKLKSAHGLKEGRHDNWTDFSDCLIAINKSWGEESEAFREHIDVVSANFWDAMLNSRSAFLKESIISILCGQDLKGTVIVPSLKGTSYMYSVKINSVATSEAGELMVDYDGMILYLHDYSKTKAFVTRDYQFVDQSYLLEGEKKADILSEIIASVILYELFKRYAPVEVKPAKQCRQHRENLEVNTVTDDVNYIDCSWFTTIIRTEGFKVRGHFRLQACGTGYSKHKLIYVNEFEKHGYVRQAKMLKNIDENN